MPDEMKPFAGGKVTSSKIPAYHYIPTEAIERLAQRFQTGVERRPDGTAWNAISQSQEVLLDREFFLDRIGHVIEHALALRDKFIRGDDLLAEDEAGAILWGGAFLPCATRALTDYKPPLNCSACGGQKTVPHSDPKQSGSHMACPACKGTGKQRH